MSAFRQFGWFAAVQAVLQRSFVSSLAVRATTNTTITPQLSDEVLNCTTTLIIPILQFVITNYIAHAFTIRFSPGYGRFYTLIFSLKALIFPCFGLLTACRSIECLAVTENTLNCALEAGALCVVARTKEWKPEEGDMVWLPTVVPTKELKLEKGEEKRSPTPPVIENKTSQVTTTEKTPPRLQKLPLDTERTAIYCQEEGVEGLHQSYIKVHGLCRLPRAHKHRHRSISEEENAKHRHNKDCHTNAMNHHSKECIENAKPCHDTVCLEKCHGSLDKPFQHCQKGQYMLVRLPPHCSVRWKRHMDYESRFRRHHSQECRREKLMELLKWVFCCRWYGGNGDSEESNPNKPYISDYDVSISATSGFAGFFAALVQLYSIFKLLMANKLEDYSAYQLTLVPYALMSFVNIVSGFFTPSYPAVYMVRSSVMEEAEGRGAVFDGWVGELEEVGELGKDGNVTCKPTTAEGAKGGSRSSEDPNTGEGQETLKDHNNEEQSKRLEDPNAGMILETQTDQNAGDQLKQSKGAEVAEERGQSKRRHISRRKRQEATMRFGKFWDIDKKITPSVTYFYHLGSSLPLIRFILKSYTVFKNLTTGSSLHVFNEVFNKKRKKRKRPEGYYYVLQIGNVKYRETTKKWMRYIMDLVMIAALAVPWVTIYHLTGFGAPKDRVAGVFFILWLTLGQLLPFLLVPSWQLINLKVWRIKLIQSILMGFLCVFLFSTFAVGGFYLVGELRYQELVKTNNNCTAARNHLLGIS